MISRLLLILLVLCGLYAAYEGWYYFLERQQLPPGTLVGEVDVGGLTLEQAGERVANMYGQTVAITSSEANERVELTTSELGFSIDLASMLKKLEAAQLEQAWWVGYIAYLIDRPFDPIIIELEATHDVDKIYGVIRLAANLLDDPAKPPRVEPATLSFLPGEAGYSADIDSTVSDVIDALYTINDRDVDLTIVYAEAPPLDFALLKQVIEEHFDSTSQGLVTVAFVKNLETGEELSINGEDVVSGLSIMKIAILIETYRALNSPPNFDQQKMLNQMVIDSSNYTANLLLDVVAGQDNAYLGSDILTESLQRLGLENSFIVTPYEEIPRPDKTTRLTDANMQPDLLTLPDISMQTTAEEVGTLLTMLYDCRDGGGALLTVYPDSLTVDECRDMLDLLTLNFNGKQMIRNGVPEGVTVAHKHGYGFDIHGDAGLVFSEGGDYVLVMYVSDPGIDWLVADFTFPIMRETSQIVYNYFNFNNPYLERNDILPSDAEETFLGLEGTETEVQTEESDANVTGDN